MAIFQLLLKNSIALMTVFIFGSTGEIITEKSGHLNLGIPGIISLGGLGGVLGGCLYMNNIPDPTMPNPFLCVFIPIIFALIFGALGGLIFAFFTVTLRSNQNVVGLCLTILGVAVSTLVFTSNSIKFDYLTNAGPYFQSLFFPKVAPTSLNFGQAVFLGHGFLTYFAIIVALVVGFIIKRTNVGLSLRSVGENPAASDSIGINVNKYRYVATIVGAMIASLGGLYLLMDLGGGADPAGIDVESYGWLAVALVIFSMWRPGIALAGSFVFSLLMTIPNVLTFEFAYQKHLMSLLPYVMTIIVLIITSILKLKNARAPSALGTSYFREDR